MNRQEIIQAYNLPRVNQSDAFKEAYRALAVLVANKDRAYERLIRGGTTNRRASTQPTITSVESSSEI